MSPAMPERVATLEANFAALVQRLDRQVAADAGIHKELTVAVQEIRADAKKRDARDNRLIGALAILIFLGNLIGPLIPRFIEALP